jgi:hypothetical protein
MISEIPTSSSVHRCLQMTVVVVAFQLGRGKQPEKWPCLVEHEVVLFLWWVQFLFQKGIERLGFGGSHEMLEKGKEVRERERERVCVCVCCSWIPRMHDLLLACACFSAHVQLDHYGLLFGDSDFTAIVYTKMYPYWLYVMLEYVLYYCYLYTYNDVILVSLNWHICCTVTCVFCNSLSYISSLLKCNV